MTTNNRQFLIETFITSSREELQLSPLTDEQLRKTTRAWLDRLRPIPDRYIDECFVKAMEQHSSSRPLIPSEILNQWWVIARAGGLSYKPPQEKKDCPYFCSRSGMMPVTADGQSIYHMDGSLRNLDPSQLTYSKACPIHRPQGVSISREVQKTIDENPFLKTMPDRTETSFVSSSTGTAAPSQSWQAAIAIAERAFGKISTKTSAPLPDQIDSAVADPSQWVRCVACLQEWHSSQFENHPCNALPFDREGDYTMDD